MRKSFFASLMIISLLFLPSIFAETTATIGGQDSSGNYHWSVDDNGTLIGNSNAELSLGGVEKTTWGNNIHFNPEQFVSGDYQNPGIGNGSTNITLLTTSTSPAKGQLNNLSCLVWSDAAESYAQVSFRVPPDYISGGAFKAFVDYNTGSDNPEIFYHVYVNADGDAWDTSYTEQTAIDPAGTAGTPELVDLPITTDFASLAADDIVTLLITRSNQEASTAQLELYYVDFYYNE